MSDQAWFLVECCSDDLVDCAALRELLAMAREARPPLRLRGFGHLDNVLSRDAGAVSDAIVQAVLRAARQAVPSN